LEIYVKGGGQMLEKQYKSLTLRLGAALLFMLLLMQVLMTVLGFMQPLLQTYLIEIAADIVYWSLFNLFYMLAYMLPVPFFMLISGKKQGEPICFDVRFPRCFALITIASIGLTLAAGFVNSLLVAPFAGEDKGTEIILAMVSPDKGYMVVLAFMMLVIVPAFCEEFLFRGLVLGNLLPYGKTVAIIGSALLFAAMHQSFGQFLYSAVAGIFLGLLYAESRSVLPSVLVHLLYNLLSLVQVVVYVRIPNESTAGKAVLGINLAMIGAGMVCAAILLLLSWRRRKASKQDERLLAGSDLSVQIGELPRGIAVRRFLSPSVTVYFVICLLVAMGEMIV
jgi:membrane protease YdiL (CAAX protease family)